MDEERVYTIGELAELAGVTPRTIRYYTAEGLLPRPDARGQYALYAEEHLLRLRLIGLLKQAYLPLGEIRARLDQLDVAQLRQLLEQSEEQPAPAAPSAAEYIAQVLAQESPPQRLAESPARYEASADAPGRIPSLAASRPAAPPAPQAPPSAPYGFAAPSAPPAHAPQAGGLLRRLIPPRPERALPQQPTPSEPEDRWRRVLLAPGVELHIRDPLAPALRERIERLLELARELFKEAD
ncbi:MAG: MerR family transcriptional regulator [Kouleothrix sp.]|nr:MerR family transcriptional regulator [Kouleothrix sp.]